MSQLFKCVVYSSIYDRLFEIATINDRLINQLIIIDSTITDIQRLEIQNEKIYTVLDKIQKDFLFQKSYDS